MLDKEENILQPNERWISRDDLDLEVLVAEDGDVYVRITGFEDSEESEEYANDLADVLPLLLFGSTTLQ